MKQKRKSSEEKGEQRGAIGEPAVEEKKDVPEQACTSKERERKMDQGASVKQRSNRGRRQSVREHRIVES